MDLSINEVRDRLSALLEDIKESPVTILSGDKPVGVLISPEEYTRLRQAQAYLRMLHIAHSIEEGDSNEPGQTLNTL